MRLKAKIKQLLNAAKQSFAELFKLLWQFKWYVILDIIFFILLLSEYFNPPAMNDKIWGSESTYGAWNYQNQQLYIQSCKYSLIISALFFLIATSNMKSHPKIARLIFLFPVYAGWLGLL